MKESDRYHKWVEWSDEDAAYIGRCPDLFGGGCHGDDPAMVYGELCDICEEWVEIFRQDGRPLPPVRVRPTIEVSLAEAA
jgi:predicted RNase H-like HicB family nuclease